MKWVRLFNRAGEPLAVSMAGIKLGDRLLVVGCSDPILIARLAAKTGLTGRALAIDEREALSARAANVAGREGALIEAATAPWHALPVDAASFDVAVIHDVLPHLPSSGRTACVGDVLRALRAGGRCLVIDVGGTRGMRRLLTRAPAPQPDYQLGDGAVRLLQSAGLRAVRTLAERDGLVFVEGVRANP
jgi:ubiquinone/menaquinone biosynthesis C-methylase UbiE